MVRVTNEARSFFKEAILVLPRFVRLLSRLIRDPRVSKADKILVGAVAAYVITPFDLIIDFMPLVGQVDDLFAVSLVLLRLVANSGEEVLRAHWTGNEDLIPWIRQIAGLSKIFLPDRVVQSVLDKFRGQASQFHISG
jgi:uncharacterized membrane protein YkvA (DUF1232 family)